MGYWNEQYVINRILKRQEAREAYLASHPPQSKAPPRPQTEFPAYKARKEARRLARIQRYARPDPEKIGQVTIRKLEWAAGFLEGEGSFFPQPTSLSPTVVATQKQKEPIQRLLEIFGGNMRPSKEDYWEWRIHGPDAAGIMMTLWSLMSPVRRCQIEWALQSWKERTLLPKPLNAYA